MTDRIRDRANPLPLVSSQKHAAQDHEKLRKPPRWITNQLLYRAYLAPQNARHNHARNDSLLFGSRHRKHFSILPWDDYPLPHYILADL